MQQTELAIMDHLGQLLIHRHQLDLISGQSHSCTRLTRDDYLLGQWAVSSFCVTAPQQSSFRVTHLKTDFRS